MEIAKAKSLPTDRPANLRFFGRSSRIDSHHGEGLTSAREKHARMLPWIGNRPDWRPPFGPAVLRGGTWSNRALPETRRTLKEDVQWAKEQPA